MVTSETSSGIRTPASERVKGLLVDVGVEQDAGAEHAAVGGHHLEGVGVVIPTLVGVADRDVEAKAAIRGARQPGIDDVGLARQRARARSGEQGGRQSDHEHG
jgi:hypothetical protein